MNTNQSTTEKPRTVYGYLRVSSERQTWGDGERRQDQDLKDWCARKGWTLSDRRFSEKHGMSAWKGKNRQEGAFAELLKVVKPGDVIAIEDHDRFSRERTLKSLAALEEIVNRGITVVFIKGGLEVTAQNFHNPEVLFRNFFGAYTASAENEKKAERINAAMATKREQIKAGRLPFGMLPPWLRWDLPRKHPDRKPVKIPEKVAIVQRLFKLCLQGHGVRWIERHMADQPPLARKWSMKSILRTLRSKAVLGYHAPSGTPNVLPAIIDERDYYAAASLLDGRLNHSVVVRPGNSNLFSGLLYCAKCGQTMTKQAVTMQGRQYSYLICSGNIRGRSDCGAKALPYHRLESAFLSLVTDTGGLRKLLAGPPEPSQVNTLEAKLADTQKRYDRVLEAIERTSTPVEELVQRLQALDSERKSLREEVEAERAKAATVTPPILALEETSKLAGQLARPEVKARMRQRVRDFVSRIDIDVLAKPKTATFRFKNTEDYLRFCFTRNDHYLMGRTQHRLPDWARPAADRLERERGQHRQRRRAARGSFNRAIKLAAGQTDTPGRRSERAW